MCRISSESKDIGYSERAGENCLLKIRSDRLGNPEKGNKGQGMSKKKIKVYATKCEKCGTINHSAFVYTSCYSCSNQPERLRRVDAEKRSDSLNSTNE